MRLGSVLLVLVTAACDGDASGQLSSCEPPLVFGYRGAAEIAPENTAPGFEAAVAAAADGVEVDIRRTADGVLVAFHDDSTRRTSDDDQTRFIEEMTWSEVQELDVGAWFGFEFVGTRVPTVSQAIAAIPPPTLILLDLKADDVLDPLATLVREEGIGDRSLASSFSVTRLERFHALLPDVPLVFCMANGDEPAEAPSSASYALLPHGEPASQTELDEVEDQGLAIALPDSATTDANAGRASFIVAGDPGGMAAHLRTLRPPECPQ